MSVYLDWFNQIQINTESYTNVESRLIHVIFIERFSNDKASLNSAQQSLSTSRTNQTNHLTGNHIKST